MSSEEHGTREGLPLKRFMQVIIGINVALLALIELSGYTFHVGPIGRLAAAEPIVSRQYAAFLLGYAVILGFVVWRRFARYPAWLLVPATLLAALWLDAFYELAAGTGPMSEDVPPTIIRLVFVACYLGGYVVLRRRSGHHQATAASATGIAGTAATG